MNQNLIAALLLSSSAVLSKVYFEERFDYAEGSNEWQKKWIQPTNFGKTTEGESIELGKFEITKGLFHADPKINTGLKTTDNLHFYSATSKLSTTFNNKDKTLVFQFSVKHEQLLDCGGGYLKLLSADTDVKSFNGESPYFLMFGPDVCGSSRRVHCILSYKEKNYLIKKEINPPADKLTHLYTFILKPDQTYEILLDQKTAASGSLFDDWDFLPPQKIVDPSAKKPESWVDDEFIVDPEDKKPEGWDDIPEFIKDPDATKPDEWDDEFDGTWTAPNIPNPDYKGEWAPRNIKNPEYKGPWIAPKIDNPEFKPDHHIYEMKNIGYVAFDLWQVTAGTIFDNILLTDDVEYAKKVAKETWADLKEKEAEEEKKHHDEILKQAATEAKENTKHLDEDILEEIKKEDEGEEEKEEL